MDVRADGCESGRKGMGKGWGKAMPVSKGTPLPGS